MQIKCFINLSAFNQLLKMLESNQYSMHINFNLFYDSNYKLAKLQPGMQRLKGSYCYPTK